MILIRHEQASTTRYQTQDDGPIAAVELPLSIESWANEGTSEAIDCDVIILQDHVGHGGSTPDDDAESWLRSWSQSGWERFDASFRSACARAEPLGKQVVIRPSATGMLSDAVCTLNWCTRGGGTDAKLLLDPMGWVVPSMVRDLEDHLDRIIELCGQIITHDRAWGVLVRSACWNEDRTSLKPSALRQGEVDTDLLSTKLGQLARQAPRVAIEHASDAAFLS